MKGKIVSYTQDFGDASLSSDAIEETEDDDVDSVLDRRRLIR
jgi:hypothetical protein